MDDFLEVLLMAHGLTKITHSENDLLEKYGYESQNYFYPVLLFNGKVLIPYGNPSKPYEELFNKIDSVESAFLLTLNSYRLFLYEWYEHKKWFSSDQESREILLDIRTSLEGGFEYIDEEYQYFFEKTAEKSKDIAELKENFSDEILTIYRGQASKSTPYDEALSWTLNKDVALFFANRFDSEDCKILESRVHIDNVIAYISDREEFEVLVPCDNLLDTPTITKTNTKK